MESILAHIVLVLSFHLLVGSTNTKLAGMLFPRDSESREVKDLSGFWNFRADMSANRKAGFEQSWFAKPLWQVINFIFPLVCSSQEIRLSKFYVLRLYKSQLGVDLH